MKQISRRAFVQAAIAATAGGLPSEGLAQAAYPSRSITMLIPFVPGGPTDLLARLSAEAIRTGLGATVIADNRPGAGGCLAAQMAIAAAPDGYTVMFGTGSTHALNNLIYDKAGYDPLVDFAPVAGVASSPNLLSISTKLKVKTVQELVAYAKENPGKLTYGSGGFGTSTHLAAELFQRAAGIKIRHIPYKGTSPALTDLAAGQISMVFDSIGTALPRATGDLILPLAVTTPERSPLRPDLPTIAESGYPGFDVTVYYGLFAPAKTPKSVIAQLNKAVNDYLSKPEMKERFKTLGLSPTIGPPETLGSAMASEKNRWEPIIRDEKIRIF